MLRADQQRNRSRHQRFLQRYFTEAVDADAGEFGRTASSTSCLRANPPTRSEWIARVEEAVRQFSRSEPQFNDLTRLAVTLRGVAGRRLLTHLRSLHLVRYDRLTSTPAVGFAQKRSSADVSGTGQNDPCGSLALR